jgi:hypothetical protein
VHATVKDPAVTDYYLLFSLAVQPSTGYGLLVPRGFVITQRRTTVGRTPLDECRSNEYKSIDTQSCPRIH